VWNLFKTLSERDSARLRRLEKDFAILADDVETCMSTIPKIHAKLRMRATRAAQAEIEEESSQSPEPAAQLSSQATTSQVSPSKLQLRELARARGFLFPQQRQIQGEK